MTERVEPPAEHRGVRWHWLASADGELEPLAWLDGRWRGVCVSVTPEIAAELRWRYVAPCIPPEPSEG